ncbi:MAG: insulinase family protein [Sphaerochaetaceae bacterium]|nr:insulinase family protein [Sphaerochaetaceae bacterium]
MDTTRLDKDDSPHDLRVGDEVCQFVVQSVDDLKDYHGKGYYLKHRETNLEVYHVANEDPECLFAYIFKTPPLNDTGAAHIIEHCILAGSQKYPVKDPFMSLLKGSVNTFMNAMTYPDYTVYPASSVLAKDFMNLFSVYTDAVFRPLLREETFWQEGIRLVTDESGQMSFDGVVFNEMKGEMSDHDSIVGRHSIRTLYPDTHYFYDSGGLPTDIVKLDYRQFAAYYGTYYHPSNCRLFLYGNLSIETLLARLDDEYLQGYASISAAGPSPIAKQWVKPKSIVVTSPAESDHNGHDASVTVSWATTLVEQPLQVLTLSVLTDILLGNPGSPLYKAIIESKLCKDVSEVSGMDTSFRQMPFTVGFKGIDPADAEKAEELVLHTLQQLVVEGIDPKLVSNAVKRQEFIIRELSTDMPTGMKVLNRALRGWTQDLAPAKTIHVIEPLDMLKTLIRDSLQDDDKPKGYFERWIEKHLLNNPHRCLLTVVPDPNHIPEQDDAIAKRVEEVRANLGETAEAVVQESTARFQRFEEEEDSREALATIPRLASSDLPQQIRVLVQTLLHVGHVPFYCQTLETNGISYIDGMFDIADLSEEEHMLMPILTRLLHMCGIGSVPYDQVALRVREYTGALYFYLESGSTLMAESSTVSALVFRMKSLADDTVDALDLLSDLLRHAALDDVERLRAVMNDLTASFEANVVSSGQMYASQRACACFSPILARNEMWNGLTQWFYLKKYDIDDKESLALLGERLSALQSKIIDASRLSIHLCTDKNLVDEARKHVEKFVSTLQASSTSYVNSMNSSGSALSVPILGEQIELFRIPASVGFTAQVVKSAQAYDPMQAHQSVLGQLITTNFLWDRVRGIGGAYGVSAFADMMERLFIFSSYRDPRIEGTLGDYRQSLEAIASYGIDSSIIEQSIISLVGREMKPLYPREAAMIAFRRAVYGISDEFRAKRRSWIVSTGSEELKAAAEQLLSSMSRCSSIAVIAGQTVLEREKKVSQRLKSVTVKSLL